MRGGRGTETKLCLLAKYCGTAQNEMAMLMKQVEERGWRHAGGLQPLQGGPSSLHLWREAASFQLFINHQYRGRLVFGDPAPAVLHGPQELPPVESAGAAGTPP